MINRKKTISICASILAGCTASFMPLVSAFAAHTISRSGDLVTIKRGESQMRINLQRFRYSFVHKGKTVAPAHSVAGLTYNGASAKNAKFNAAPSVEGPAVHFTVTNDDNEKAAVKVYPLKNAFRISVEPVDKSTEFISARVGPVGGPLYGLGDRGGRGNLLSPGPLTDTSIANTGDGVRFSSTFLIAPSKNFAQVVISQPKERMLLPTHSNTPHRLNANSNRMEMSVSRVKSVRNFYYFLGEPKQIYAAFAEAKKQTGFPDAKPHYEMFGIGWEAWPFLRWQTDARTVRSLIREFLSSRHNYPLGWAVIGSGFWEAGGSTVSFGRWDKSKYPGAGKAPDLVRELRSMGLKVLLGLRTTFTDCFGSNEIAVRLPENKESCSGSRITLTPEFIEGTRKNYFAKIAGGKDFITGSNVFPKWGSTGRHSLRMLDVTNPAAINWYLRKTELWGVDGWKEDSMMSFAPSHTYHDAAWNLPMKKLHDRGDLVMARNAYVGNPGSILRINDTFGEQIRIPQLVLAYAASGAPNVYTDSIGNDDRENAGYLERHAKLSALTPVMAFGVKPWDFANSRNFRAAVDWHEKYRPYIYSAALKSFASGYPYTITPLPIAYPEDGNTYNLDDNRMWQWLIDESILAAPIFNQSNRGTTRDIYLPEGIWMDMNTNIGYSGNRTLRGHDQGGTKIPAFVGGKGVIVSTDGVRAMAEIWPIKPNNRKGVEYEYRHFKKNVKGENLKSKITLDNTGWDVDLLSVTDTTNGSTPSITKNRSRGGISFRIIPGHNYKIKGGGSVQPGGSQRGLSPGLRNVALKKPAKVDSTYASQFTAAKAVDGDNVSNDSRWISRNTVQPHFIEIDLQAPTFIQKINFWTGFNNVGPIKKYVLSYRQNGEWKMIASPSSNTKSEVEHRLSKPVKATGIRLSSKEWMKVYEIEAIGLSSKFNLLSDDFNDKDIKDWRLSSGSWDASSRAVVARTRGSAKDGSIVRGGAGWRNYFVSTDVRIMGGRASGGVMGRYKNNNNFYLFRLHRETNRVQLLKKVGGKFSLIKETNFDIKLGTVYNLRLVMQEKELRGFVDGRLLVSATDNKHSTGMAGLRFFDGPRSKTAAIFDNVGVGHN